MGHHWKGKLLSPSERTCTAYHERQGGGKEGSNCWHLLNRSIISPPRRFDRRVDRHFGAPEWAVERSRTHCVKPNSELLSSSSSSSAACSVVSGEPSTPHLSAMGSPPPPPGMAPARSSSIGLTALRDRGRRGTFPPPPRTLPPPPEACPLQASF